MIVIAFVVVALVIVYAILYQVFAIIDVDWMNVLLTEL